MSSIAFAAPSLLAAAFPAPHRRQISIRAQEAKERAAAKRAKAANLLRAVSQPIASTDATIIKRAARQPVTIAFVMALELVTMREATKRLTGLELGGQLVRGPGKRVLTWRAA